jgi:hypothetical protein
MKALQLLFSKNYWYYIFSIKKTITAILSTIGVIWLLVESLSFFSTDLSNSFKSHWGWLSLFAIIWVIYENRPVTEFCYKLHNRDIKIQISIANLFSFKGNLVIPVNTSFDTSFDHNLISQKSTQGQFTVKFFAEPRYLDQDIQSSLANQPPYEQLPSKRVGNPYRYEIGKVIKLKLQNDRFAYLTAISNMNDSGVASTNFDNILTSLGMLWDFVTHHGELGDINIPIIGTGHGRLLENRETIIKAIVHSFISSTTTGKRFCDKLNIVIHPSDFKKHEIDIKRLKEFLRLTCEHYEFDTKVTGIGNALG